MNALLIIASIIIVLAIGWYVNRLLMKDIDEHPDFIVNDKDELEQSQMPVDPLSLYFNGKIPEKVDRVSIGFILINKSKVKQHGN